MNVQSWFIIVAGAGNRAAAEAGFFRQIQRAGLSSARHMKLLSVCARSVALLLFVASLLCAASAQTNYYVTNGLQYAIAGSLPGDQVHPDVAISSSGGVVVWQDNVTDGDGWGISFERLDGTLSGTLDTYRVNVTGAGDQENPRVALLKNGGAAFVWQGGLAGYQHIFGRFLTPTNTFLTTTDLVVSTNAGSFQVNPAIAVLNNSNVVVVWQSYNQAGSNSLLDVYAKILSPTGATVKSEFLVNQFTSFNQRTPAVAALANGGFVVVWVSEQQRTLVPSLDQLHGTLQSSIITPSVDIYGRLFLSNGVAASSEFLVSTSSIPSANPSAAAASDGSFMVAWSGYDTVSTNGWDVYARTFSSAGVGQATVQLNSYVHGNQYGPQLKAMGLDYMAVWTSLGEDGSREGVYGRYIHSNGTLVGDEFRVNTTTIAQQMHPAIASDGANQFLAVWTSFGGAPYNFDLYAQRYINQAAVLDPMSPPFVWAPFVLSSGVYQPQLVVDWPPVVGLAVSNYEVYVNGEASPASVVTSNMWIMTAGNGLTAGSTNYFAVDYVRSDGRRSPISGASQGITWSGPSWGGIPREWMASVYGSDTNTWPPAGAQLAPNLSLYQVFLSGGNPTNSSTWLKVQITASGEGKFVKWSTQPGATYQVQLKTNLVAAWSNFGSPRFAAGTNDQINIGSGTAGYFQVQLLR